MKTSKALSLGIVALVLGLVVLSGCTQQGTTYPPTDNGNSNTTPPTTEYSPLTPDQYANELAGGTGSGSDDITTSDLDAMEESLDELEQGTDSLGESNV